MSDSPISYGHVSARQDSQPAQKTKWPTAARLFHSFLIATNFPATWSAWQTALVAALPILLVSGLWYVLISHSLAVYVGVTLLVFCALDAAVLLVLPRLRISFGPVPPQLYVLLAPRLLVSVLTIPLALWIGPTNGWLTLIGVNLLASAALAWGAIIEPARPHYKEIEIPILPAAEAGKEIRVLHISDLHLERIGKREEAMLDMVRDADPDLIVLTGDYLNLSNRRDPQAHAEAHRLLDALSRTGRRRPAAPPMTFAVLGSPAVDRYSAPLFNGLSIHLMRDEMEELDLGNGRRLTVLGMDCSHQPRVDSERLAAFMDRAPQGIPTLLLYHSPELMPAAVSTRVNLYVCGHTHGGQVRLPLYGAVMTASKMGKRYEMGLYHEADSYLYVSPGIGLEGKGAPRVRFLCPPEITLFRLTSVTIVQSGPDLLE